ncbi:MAG: pirin family protein [SAR324 cluster bacterium]|nr:pirin family protein [SAR324 cluster bacterium]
MRKVTKIIESTHVLEGGGFPVARPFPIAGNLQFDPFLLLDHFGPIVWPPGGAIGAPDHPHRGFETITYLIEGQMVHKDSGGNIAKMGNGEAQWMVAGSGLVHSEMPPEDFKAKGGLMHGFQLWVNLPMGQKMIPPAYKNILAHQIPKVELKNGFIKVLAGELAGVTGPASPVTPIIYAHLHLDAKGEAGSSYTVDLPLDYSAACYSFSGTGLFGEEKTQTPKDRLVCFGEGSSIIVEQIGKEPLDVLILAGKPLNEPIARHGPFVMNSKEEIQQAVYDYQSGKMGQIAPNDLSEP